MGLLIRSRCMLPRVEWSMNALLIARLENAAASTRASLCYLDRIGQIVSPAGTTVSQSATGSYPVPGRAGGGTVLAREYVGK